MIRRRVMAAIAAVGDETFDARADLRLDLGDHRRQSMAVIGIARQRFGMGDELAALRAMQRRGERDLHAELVRPMRLALVDAFDLRRVQRIDLLAALVLTLFAHPLGEPERATKDLLYGLLASDLARNVAHHPAEIGPQRPQRFIGPLELLGVGVALVGDQRALTDALVGLAQS